MVNIAEGGGTVKGNVLPAGKVCNGSLSYATTQWPFMVAAYAKALEMTLEMGKRAGNLR